MHLHNYQEYFTDYKYDVYAHEAQSSTGLQDAKHTCNALVEETRCL